MQPGLEEEETATPSTITRARSLCLSHEKTGFLQLNQPTSPLNNRLVCTIIIICTSVRTEQGVLFDLTIEPLECGKKQINKRLIHRILAIYRDNQHLECVRCHWSPTTPRKERACTEKTLCLHFVSASRLMSGTGPCSPLRSLEALFRKVIRL